MSVQQNATERNKTLLLDGLDQQYQDAVMLLYGGFTYQRIAKECKVTYSSVRRWFMSGGICKPAYDELLRQKTKENKKLAKQIDAKLKEYAPEALETLYKAAKTGNWLAAQSLLDRAGYSPLNRAQVTIDPDVKNRVMEILREGRKENSSN